MKKTIYLLICLLIIVMTVGCNGNSNPESSAAETENPYPVASPVEDFEYEDCEGGIMITRYVGEGGEVVIPEEIDGKPVKEIKMYAFSQNRNVIAVTLPPSVEVINAGAFYYATRLQRVTLNEGLKKIGNGAFEECQSLVEITLPSTLTDLGMNAFYNCVILKHINIPRSLKVKNNDEAGGWGHGAFSCTGIETVEFEEGVNAIPSTAFAGTPLHEVTLPSSVKVIYSYAFASCPNLTTVNLNDGLETIDIGAFSTLPNLTEIVIPSSVKSVDETAFSKCEKLEKVIFEGDAPERYLTDEELGFVPYNVNYTIYYNEGAEGFTTPVWCGYRCAPVGSEVRLDTYGDVEYYIENGDVIVAGVVPGTEELVIPSEIDGRKVVKIGLNAFWNNTTLRYVTVPSSVKVIEARAFFNATALEEISLAAGLEQIGDCAFSYSSLKEVYLPSGLLSVGIEAFSGCSELKKINLPASLTECRKYAFANSGIESVEIEDGLESIAECAFYHAALKEAHIPGSVKTIGFAAFGYCNNLEKVTFGDGVEVIENNAFADAYMLVEVVIPLSVKKIYDNSFNRCSSLVSMTFEGDAPELLHDEERDEETKANYTVYYSEGAVGFDAGEWSIFNLSVK